MLYRRNNKSDHTWQMLHTNGSMASASHVNRSTSKPIDDNAYGDLSKSWICLTMSANDGLCSGARPQHCLVRLARWIGHSSERTNRCP